MKNISQHLKTEPSNGRVEVALAKTRKKCVKPKSVMVLALFAICKELSNLVKSQ